jgi:glycosyltransferase involved in cell wall biosynthesis
VFGSSDSLKNRHMTLDAITPLILTYNEAPNIGRTLERLRWARRILVVDSGSADGTIEIVQNHPQAEVVHHAFSDFAKQCNYGLTLVESPWVLSLDADYELSEALVEELRALRPTEDVAGFVAHFVYRIYGKPLRGSLYPPRTVLFRRDKAIYQMKGHCHRLVVQGKVLSLAGVIYHDDRKPLARWLASQQRYARDEAAYLLSRRDEKLGLADRLRLMGWPAPVAAFLYTLLVKRCLLDGWPGWFYALQRLIAESLLALEITDRRLQRIPCCNRSMVEYHVEPHNDPSQ